MNSKKQELITTLADYDKNLGQVTLTGETLDDVLDMTCGLYGMQRELKLVAGVNVDLSPERKATIRADNRKLPFRSGIFRTVLFDPPFAVHDGIGFMGSGHGGGLGPIAALYQYGCYRTPGELKKAVYLGLREAARVCQPGGTVVFKWCDTAFSQSKAIRLRPRCLEAQRTEIRKSASNAKGGNFTFHTWLKHQNHVHSMVGGE